MAVYHLRKDEVIYELKIRRASTEGNVNELKKRLASLLASSAHISRTICSEMQTEEEVEVCEEKFRDIKALVEEYEGNYRDNEYARLIARLQHLHTRLGYFHLGLVENEDRDEKVQELRQATRILLDGLEASRIRRDQERSKKEERMDIKEDVEVNTEEKKKEEGTREEAGGEAKRLEYTTRSQGDMDLIPEKVSVSPKPTEGREVEIEGTRPVPVYKWGLVFTNTPGQSIGGFLERVEELRRARGVTKALLFRSAVDLFGGSALIWYRSTVGRISSWDELCEEMKMVFQTPDYDDMLMQEIMQRTQGENETIDLYLAAMEGLYGRLSNSVPENIRLRQIVKNLNSFLQDKLCMFSVTSIQELRQLGRKAELGRLRTVNCRPPPRPNTVLEPDLAYSRNDPSKGRTSFQVHAFSSQPPASSGRFRCWNCLAEGHRYSQCQEARNLFCYGCGAKGVRKLQCGKCNPSRRKVEPAHRRSESGSKNE